MKLILQDKNEYVLKAGVGEEVIGGLQEFCKEQGVEAASFWAIGAAKEVKLGWYDVEAKKYTWKEVQAKLEIVSLLGNVAVMKGETLVHAHGSFSDETMQMMGGHVAKMVVGAACEIFLTQYAGKIEKAHDEDTGLNLMT